jgi:hypothetical protein
MPPFLKQESGAFLFPRNSSVLEGQKTGQEDRIGQENLNLPSCRKMLFTNCLQFEWTEGQEISKTTREKMYLKMLL